MRKLVDLISREVSQAFAAAGYDAAYGKVTVSNRPDLCEFQCNGALPAAKVYHKAPMAIAEEVAAQLSGSGSFTVTKVNENRVNVTGFFKSAGLISGEMMNIAAYSVDDPDMKVTYAFGPAYVKGDVLTFEYSVYGRATKNGLTWSYDKKSKVTATRVKGD